jgi:hypothetical protein
LVAAQILVVQPLVVQLLAARKIGCLAHLSCGLLVWHPYLGLPTEVLRRAVELYL